MELIIGNNKHFVLSVDRINNNLGYIKGNIVLCCNIINSMKNDLETDVFFELCRKIIERKIEKII